jgi:L-amino acid N-acyltransferase YncA
LTPEIRDYAPGDWPAVWAIIRDVVRAQETFPYDPAMTEEQGRATWIEGASGRTIVVLSGGKVLGTAKMGPNRGGPGAHIATASFMVAAEARGQGLGGALSREAIAWARRQGFAGVQFNAVVETNTAAVGLYERLGFRVIGTVPRAFEHPVSGRVGLHLMYLEF